VALLTGTLCSRLLQGLMHSASPDPLQGKQLQIVTHPPTDGIPHAASDTMKLTQPILKTISRQLCHGNPWWALVVLNEYLEPSSPLHTALLQLFRRRVHGQSVLAQKLCAGALYENLSGEERLLIGSRVSGASISKPLAPREHSSRLRASKRRRASRGVRRSAFTPRIRMNERGTIEGERYLRSTALNVVPALRVVQGAARRPS
jgi:hypothetical protein